MRILSLLPLAVLASGCIELDVTVHVKADGSGRIEERVRFDTSALEPMFEMMEQLAGPKGKKGAGRPSRPWDFDQKELKARAADRGAGVKLVRAEAMSVGARRGWDATYAFTDVAKLQLDFEGSGPVAGSSPRRGRDAMRFEFVKGSPATLVVKQPPPAKSKGGGPPPPDAEQLAQVKPLLENLRIRMRIAVDGKIVSTNAKHVDGQAITLMDVAFERIAKNDATVKALVATQSTASLAKIDGVQVELQPRVTVKFK